MYCGECGEECYPVKNFNNVADDGYGSRVVMKFTWHSSDCCDGELFRDEDLTIPTNVMDFDDE